MNNFVILFVIALFGTSSSLNVERANRIMGGSPAIDNQFTYMISLQEVSQLTNYTRGHRCGGVLVTPEHALTSASCLFNNVNGVHTLIAPTEYRVFSGAAVLTNDASADRHRTVESFTVHPNYSPGTPYVNDIAVITLTSTFPSNTAVSPLPLSTNDATTLQGWICESSGWGSQNNTNSPSTQLMTHLPKIVVEQNACRLAYVGQLGIQDTMICAIGTNITAVSSSCTGDSGNPLVCNGNVNGILVVNGHDCSDTGITRPEVYTRISSFSAWILGTTGQTPPTPPPPPPPSPGSTTTPAPGGASTFQPAAVVLAVITIVQMITANVFNKVI